MKIKTIRIENFRSFQDETIHLNRYSCFVGPNGAGKSSILAALNVFFREQSSSSTDITKLIDEDYFQKDVSKPIRITVTFDDLSSTAQTQLSAYVRQNELIVTAEAVFDPNTEFGQVRYYGQRLAMKDFAEFFAAEKDGAKAPVINDLYTKLQKQYPDLPAVRSKEDKADALRSYEASHSDKCILIPSEDNFYGISGTSKLASFIQWVYVPAVKDAGEEGQESKNTALSKLMSRAINSRTNLNAELESLTTDTLIKYNELLYRNQDGLTAVAKSLQTRLAGWTHQNVRLEMTWRDDPKKSVVLQPPVAGIKTGETNFLGNLARMGHGLQRSYLLALLQELAGSENENAPTLILGCEEPELYQHPPQARHFADVFSDLATKNNQILATTHSPLFVSGDGFENTRIVRSATANKGSQVKSLTFQDLCSRIRNAIGEDENRKTEGLIAKIHQALQPSIAEMFFARIPILVEGLEDVSYITTQLHLLGLWSEFRRLGCHLIPANGKDKIIQPLAMCMSLNLPVYVIFDADTDTKKPEHRGKHERDNRALVALLGASHSPFPTIHIWALNHTIWHTNMTDAVKFDFQLADYERICNATRIHYAQEGGLEKNDLFIADWLSSAHAEGLESQTLTQLCKSILSFATLT